MVFCEEYMKYSHCARENCHRVSAMKVHTDTPTHCNPENGWDGGKMRL